MKTLILSVACALFFVTPAAATQTGSPFTIAKCEADALTFSSVRLPRAVVANGTALAAGVYEIRITTEHPAPAAGQSLVGECWVAFVKNNAIAAREVASVISDEDIGAVAKGPAPKPNGVRVDVLKDGEYLRVWINSAGTHYLVNMPVVR